MYSRIQIRNFRALRELAIDGLRRINLFVGPNNIGKTSLLEAVWLLRGPGNPRLTANLAYFRGFDRLVQTPGLLWHGLFHDMKVEDQIEIKAMEAGGPTHSLRITLSKGMQAGPEATEDETLAQIAGTSVPAGETLRYEYMADDNPPVASSISALRGIVGFEIAPVTLSPSIFLSPTRGTNATELAERFTKVEDAEGMAELVRSLKLLEPNLSSLSLGFVEKQPLIRGIVEGLERRVPLPLLGGGVVRLVEILLAILTSAGGLVLIDEVENGVYHKNLESVWRAIDSASRDANAQILATTHSLECVQAAVAAFANGRGGDFRLHRLERKDDEVGVTTYDHETARAALEMNLEVR